MLACLSTCSRHVRFVNFGVWVGGDVNVPVNLLTSCMLHELRGLGGGMLMSLSTCSTWLKKVIDATAVSKTIGQSLQRSLIQKGARKTPVARSRRYLLVYYNYNIYFSFPCTYLTS